jgi:hypothetical protein
MTYLTVIPAYGRDYRSAKLAKADWHDGKDFIIADLFNPYDGKPINKKDASNYNVVIRFNRLTKTVNV